MVREKITVGKNEAVKFKTEALLNSKVLSNYQPDFAKTLLTEPEYTLLEAKAILNRFFRKEEKQ